MADFTWNDIEIVRPQIISIKEFKLKIFVPRALSIKVYENGECVEQAKIPPLASVEERYCEEHLHLMAYPKGNAHIISSLIFQAA